MKGTLRLKDSGWVLEDHNGNEVWNGDYPLIEDEEFIETAGEKLINGVAKGLEVSEGKASESEASKQMTALSIGKLYERVDERTMEE